MKIRSYIAVFCLLALVVSTMFITSCVKKKDAKEETPAVEKSEVQKSATLQDTAAPQDTVKGPTYKNLVDGEDISLENLKGHVLIIDFWTTWCGPCRVEIPGFIELYDKYKDQKVTIVGISLDRGGPSVVEKFIKQYKMSYPVIIATPQLLDEYQNAIGRRIQSIPTTIIMDREGKIMAVHVGAKPKSVFEAEIQKLL